MDDLLGFDLLEDDHHEDGYDYEYEHQPDTALSLNHRLQDELLAFKDAISEQIAQNEATQRRLQQWLVAAKENERKRRHPGRYVPPDSLLSSIARDGSALPTNPDAVAKRQLKEGIPVNPRAGGGPAVWTTVEKTVLRKIIVSQLKAQVLQEAIDREQATIPKPVIPLGTPAPAASSLSAALKSYQDRVNGMDLPALLQELRGPIDWAQIASRYLFRIDAGWEQEKAEQKEAYEQYLKKRGSSSRGRRRKQKENDCEGSDGEGAEEENDEAGGVGGGVNGEAYGENFLKGKRPPTRREEDCQQCFEHFLDPDVVRTKWTGAEDKKLLELATHYKGHYWDEVARELGTGRTEYQCLVRYQRSLNRNLVNRPWTEAEDEHLKELVATYGDSNWQTVANLLSNRTREQCMARYNKTLRPGLRGGNWSAAEDLKLQLLVEVYGRGSWSKIAAHMPNRNDQKCRERYENLLAPEKKKSPWSAQEVTKLLDAVANHGPGSWSKIKAHVPGRTDAECRIKWETVVDIKDYDKYYELHQRKKVLLARGQKPADRPQLAVTDLETDRKALRKAFKQVTNVKDFADDIKRRRDLKRDREQAGLSEGDEQHEEEGEKEGDEEQVILEKAKQTAESLRHKTLARTLGDHYRDRRSQSKKLRLVLPALKGPSTMQVRAIIDKRRNKEDGDDDDEEDADTDRSPTTPSPLPRIGLKANPFAVDITRQALIEGARAAKALAAAQPTAKDEKAEPPGRAPPAILRPPSPPLSPSSPSPPRLCNMPPSALDTAASSQSNAGRRVHPRCLAVKNEVKIERRMTRNLAKAIKAEREAQEHRQQKWQLLVESQQWGNASGAVPFVSSSVPVTE